LIKISFFLFFFFRSLSHPNIVQYLGMFIDSNGNEYIVTEYMPQGNLNTFIQMNKDKFSIVDLLLM